jgi:hypothetical protein
LGGIWAAACAVLARLQATRPPATAITERKRMDDAIQRLRFMEGLEADAIGGADRRVGGWGKDSGAAKSQPGTGI